MAKRAPKKRVGEKQKKYMDLIRRNRALQAQLNELANARKPVKKVGSSTRAMNWAEKVALAATVAQALVSIVHNVWPNLHR